jgi:phage N-6-adenine-methyltransferase
LFEDADIISGAEAQELLHLETIIEHGLHTFVDVGTALLKIRDSRLYRTAFDTFEDYCRQRWGLKRQRAYELIDAATVVGNLSEISDIQPARESHAAPLAALPPETQRVVWQQAVETAPNGKVTAAHVQSVVDEYKAPIVLRTCPRCGKQWAAPLDYCPYCNHTIDERIAALRKPLPLAAANHAVSDNPDYDGDEWYTPATYIEAARSVMGAIDLDPATSAAAQEVVKAATWYTKQDDGLSVPWEGRVWINPPYSMPLIRQFTSKLIDEYENGNVTQAIILTNNSSDTAWFHDLLSHYPACFTRGRVQFWRPDHDAFGARQGQVLFYLGDNIEAFTHVFCAFGQVVQRI